MSDPKLSLHTLRHLGGFYSAETYGLIEVYGRDAAKFLQAQTTNDAMGLPQLAHQLSCLLDRKAHIQAFFDLYRRHDSFRIIVEKEQIEDILAHFDHYRIADKVEFLDLSASGKFFVLQGPRCRRVLNVAVATRNPGTFRNDVVDVKLWHIDTHVFRKSTTGEDGYFIWVSNADSEKFLANLSAVSTELGLVKLDPAVLETARIEAGITKFGIEFDKQNFMPETGLDQHAASYTKGCFLGQEVLARVKSQGAPTRGLIGLLFPAGEHHNLHSGSQLILGGEEIATIKSTTFSDTLNRDIAIASAKRDYRTPDKTLAVTINGAALKPVIALLPFYQPEALKVKAREVYEQALQLYAKEDDSDAQSQAVDLLRESIEMDPTFEDGYEALGVILSKRHHVDEAISLMKLLVELNPDSVMAHTNLSVFYLEKGLKEQAEDEKAISVSIRMWMAVAQGSKQTQEADSAEKERKETEERLDMFKQVIEIDAEDLLANYGMGSCYVALKQHQKAIPYLLKAIEVKPSYTVAYTSLAQAYEATGQTQLAVSTYEKGIEVAAKRGDMMPLTDMQKRLSALKSGKAGELV